MGWFDQQIKQRIQADDEVFSEAMAGMAGVVMGQRLSQALSDSRIKAKDAIEEVLKYYHVKPQPLPDNVSDVDGQLEYLMRPSGIMRRTVALEGDWYRQATGAMLGVLKADGTPIALLPKGFGYQYRDIATGRHVNVNRATAPLIDRQAICFYKPLPMKRIGIPDLLRYIAGSMDVSDYVMIGSATLAATLLGLFTPRISRIIYGTVITSGSMQLVAAVFGLMMCVGISSLLIGVTRAMIMARITGRLDMAVQASAMMRVLALPADFFRGCPAGETAARLSYINQLCSNIATSLLTTGLSSLFSLVYISQMVQYGPGLVVPGLAVIAFTVVFSVITALVNVGETRKIMASAAKESGLSYALVSGIQKIKLAGAEKRAFAQWAGAYTTAASHAYTAPMILKLAPAVTTGIALVGTIVIYYFTITTGVALADYFAFNSSFGLVMGSFTAIVGMVSTFAQIKPILEMVRPILDTVPEVSPAKKVVTQLTGGIEVNNVSFRYTDTQPLILDNLSLKIRPGQYVAIVGATGCGKTTLMRLLLGFETPQRGAIYYDGRDMSTLDLRSLRRRIGAVMQDGKLFSGDIFSNITITAPQLDLNGAWQAAETAGIADDIRAMPMGMNTLISEGSGGISGGQRQRLMIARAIAGQPRILMFDEATSALDNIAQKQVSEALGRLRCTRVVIAHRLSTIRDCDRIIVLDRGRIIEDGTYDQLLAADGFFSRLVARQRLDDGPGGNHPAA